MRWFLIIACLTFSIANAQYELTYALSMHSPASAEIKNSAHYINEFLPAAQFIGTCEAKLRVCNDQAYLTHHKTNKTPTPPNLSAEVEFAVLSEQVMIGSDTYRKKTGSGRKGWWYDDGALDNWQLSTETFVINGFECYKAVRTFRPLEAPKDFRYSIEVYYTLDVGVRSPFPIATDLPGTIVRYQKMALRYDLVKVEETIEDCASIPEISQEDISPYSKH